MVINIYNNLLVVYVFRHGQWYHPVEIDYLEKGDEVLYGSVKDLANIKQYFYPRSEKFSKLRTQVKELERTIHKKIPIKY